MGEDKQINICSAFSINELIKSIHLLKLTKEDIVNVLHDNNQFICIYYK